MGSTGYYWVFTEFYLLILGATLLYWIVAELNWTWSVPFEWAAMNVTEFWNEFWKRSSDSISFLAVPFLLVVGPDEFSFVVVPVSFDLPT